jgi:hypothetical protein
MGERGVQNDDQMGRSLCPSLAVAACLLGTRPLVARADIEQCLAGCAATLTECQAGCPKAECTADCEDLEDLCEQECDYPGCMQDAAETFEACLVITCQPPYDEALEECDDDWTACRNGCPAEEPERSMCLGMCMNQYIDCVNEANATRDQCVAGCQMERGQAEQQCQACVDQCADDEALCEANCNMQCNMQCVIDYGNCIDGCQAE